MQTEVKSIEDLTNELEFDDDLLENVRGSMDDKVQFKTFTSVFGNTRNSN